MKKNILKFAFLLLFITAFGFSADAQIRVGGGLIFNTEEGAGLGIGIRGEYTIAEKIVLAPGYNFFFEEDNASVREFNFNVHYPFAIGESVSVYPFVGFNRTSISVDLGGIFGNLKVSEVGANLGGGVNIGINERMSAFGELKYVILFADGNEYKPLILSAGVLFTIGG